MNKINNNYNVSFVFWLLILIVFCLLFQLSLNRLGWNWQYGGDSPSYKAASEEILKGNFYHQKRLPVYPIFLLTSNIFSEKGSLILQNIMNFACPILMYLIIFKLFRNSFISFFFSLISFMYYDNTIYTNYLLTEVPARLLVIALTSCFFLSFKNKYFFIGILSFLLSGLKSQFWYIFIIVYTTSALFKFIPMKKAFLLLLTASIIPILYNIQSLRKSDTAIHNNNTINLLCRKQLFRHDHLWELELYPKSEKNIDIIKKLIYTHKDAQMNNFYFYDFYLKKFMDETSLKEDDACKLLKKLYFKVFLYSCLVKPHYHIKSVINDLYISLDRLDTQLQETIAQKIRRYLRHSIEIMCGSLFVIAFFSAILNLFLRIKNVDSSFYIFPIFLITYIFIIYFIERQGGRHRIPINDSMIIMTLYMFKEIINKLKGDSNTNAAC